MAGTLAWNSGARGAASSVDFDSTGESVTLPTDTQRVQVYAVSAAWLKYEALGDSNEGWQPIPAGTWCEFAELDGRGTIAIKADSTATKVYAQAITPRGVKGGR